MMKKSTFRYLLTNFVICISILLELTSCISVKPGPTPLSYFQSENPDYPVYIKTITPEVSKIQQDDILGIIVTSKNKESNEILNFYNVNTLPQSSFSPGTSGSNSQLLGYSIDSTGNVSMPFIGKQKVEGLTLEQAEEKIRTEVEKTLKGTSVSIRFINHKFSVLGEVARVGAFSLLNDRTTIIDAIIAAGDITLYGKRDSVKVMRNVNGKREIGMINLTSRAAFTSPYFYVKNDDIIYIEPTKDKTIPAAQPTTGLFLQRFPIYLSLVSTLISLGILVSRL